MNEKILMNLLKYMKIHNKKDTTFFELKHLSKHLSLSKEETFEILRIAKNNGLINQCGMDNSTINYRDKFCITQDGINKVNDKNKKIKHIFIKIGIFFISIVITVMIDIYLEGM